MAWYIEHRKRSGTGLCREYNQLNPAAGDDDDGLGLAQEPLS